MFSMIMLSMGPQTVYDVGCSDDAGSDDCYRQEEAQESVLASVLERLLQDKFSMSSYSAPRTFCSLCRLERSFIAST